MKNKSLSTIAVATGVLLAAILSCATPRPLRAETAVQSATIALNAGQTRIIDHLKIDSKPTIRVIENPHALVIHDETPGQLVLLGAERGQWEVTVTRDDGAQIDYRVSIAAIADRASPLDAGTGSVEPSDQTLPQNVAASPDHGGSSETVLSTHLVAAFSADVAPQENLRANDNRPAPQMPTNSQPASAQMASSFRYRTDPPVSDSSLPVSVGLNYLPADLISVPSGGSEIIDFPRRLKRISIADSTIADIQITSPYQLNLIGHQPGFTTLAVWDYQGHYQQRQVRIETGGKQQVMLNAIVAELDRSKLEAQGIDFSVAMAGSGISLASLPGLVATPFGPTSQLSGGANAVPGVSPPGGQLLPLLLSSAMTYGLSTAGSTFSTQSLFQFLESHNLGASSRNPICSRIRVRAHRFCPAARFRLCWRKRSTPRSYSSNSAPR